MGTEADYLIDQHFDRKHGEYGDPDPAQEAANEEHRREEQRKLEQTEMEKHFEKHPHG